MRSGMDWPPGELGGMSGATRRCRGGSLARSLREESLRSRAAAAAPMPRTRSPAALAATHHPSAPRAQHGTGRVVLLAPGSLSPCKITVKGAPAARRRCAAQTLDNDLSRPDLGTYQEDGRRIGLDLDGGETHRQGHDNRQSRLAASLQVGRDDCQDHKGPPSQADAHWKDRRDYECHLDQHLRSASR